MKRVGLSVVFFFGLAILITVNCKAGIKAKPQMPALPDSAAVNVQQVLEKYTILQRAKIGELARNLGVSVPQEYEQWSQAMASHDFKNASNLFIRIREKASNNTVDNSFIYAQLLPVISEAMAVHYEFSQWPPHLLIRYVDEILARLPDNAVFLGGSDSGRFLITAFSDVRRPPKISVMTQQGLIDNSYYQYARLLRGGNMILPTNNSSAWVEYVVRVNKGLIAPHPQITIRNGQCEANSSEAVMILNGIFLEEILSMNTGRTFYVELGAAIPQLFAYLEPDGPIMHYRPGRNALTKDVMEKDSMYWAALEQALMADKVFIQSPKARVAFSQLRTMIGACFLVRDNYGTKSAEQVLQQAIRLDPQNPGPSYILAQAYDGQNEAAKALPVIQALLANCPNVPWRSQAEQFMAALEKKALGQASLKALVHRPATISAPLDPQEKPIEKGVYYAEDFQHIANGLIPAKWTIVYDGRGKGEQKVLMERDNRYLRIAGMNNWSAVLRKDFEHPMPDRVLFEVRIRRIAGKNSLGIANGKLGGDALLQDIGIRDAAWHLISVKVDFKAAKASFTVDGHSEAKDLTLTVQDPHGKWAKFGNLPAIVFDSNNDEPMTELHLDDIKITVLPIGR